MASELYVETLKGLTSGANANKIVVPSGQTLDVSAGTLTPSSGQIIQVQYTQYTGVNTYTLTASVETEITDLSVSITPQFANSTIKLECAIFGEFGNYNNEYNHTVYFFRDSTKLAHPSNQGAAGQNRGVGMLGMTYYTGTDNNSTGNYGQITYFDTPSSTSQITYKVGMTVQNASETFTLNRTVGDLGAQFEAGVSYICATEIAG